MKLKVFGWTDGGGGDGRVGRAAVAPATLRR